MHDPTIDEDALIINDAMSFGLKLDEPRRFHKTTKQLVPLKEGAPLVSWRDLGYPKPNEAMSPYIFGCDICSEHNKTGNAPKYYLCMSIEGMWKLMQETPDEKRAFNIIYTGNIYGLFIDFDSEDPELIRNEKLRQYVMNWIYDKVNLLIMRYTDTTSHSCVVTDSSRDEKASMHAEIRFKHHYVSSPSILANMFIQEIITMILMDHDIRKYMWYSKKGGPSECSIDSGIYQENRLVRMASCVKWGKLYMLKVVGVARDGGPIEWGNYPLTFELWMLTLLTVPLRSKFVMKEIKDTKKSASSKNVLLYDDLIGCFDSLIKGTFC